MALLKILTYGNKVLREKSKPIEKITPELVELAKDMLETMYDAPGCGLAAPQIGKNIRLVVIDTSIPDEEEPNPFIMFNPEWEPEADSESVVHEEGCLSLPGIWGDVTRSSKIKVRYTDINGNPQELSGCEGLFARCVQHETDHLEGQLFVDKVSAADRAMNASKLKKIAKENS